jgi:hypothetical protein
MTKLKTVKEANGTVGKSKIKIELTPEIFSDLLSTLELAADLAEYAEIAGDHSSRLRAIAVQDSIATLARKHKIKIK